MKLRHSLGPYISAMDIVRFLSTPEMHYLACKRLNREKLISVRTAQCWLQRMGYRWQREKKGQYTDGRECKDVVQYRQQVFLPVMAEYEKSMRKWDNEGKQEGANLPADQHVVVWFHNESIFYAHDRRKVCWVHDSESAKPYAKGKGASLMITDF
ncbi:uncharacterized protein EI90DRAFT_2940083, partial [Cantharellus anzutake]|uniref:uncharacterized protein n=1 Tax=Cantharellus anzutake TaxID=1750568 RepID=UPI00190468B6